MIKKHFKVFYRAQHESPTVEVLRCWDGRRPLFHFSVSALSVSAFALTTFSISACQHFSICFEEFLLFQVQAAALGRLPKSSAKPFCWLRSHPQPVMSAPGICCLWHQRPALGALLLAARIQPLMNTDERRCAVP